MSMLIKNGTIVNADGSQQADVFIDGGTIAQIGPNLDVTADEGIDATGKQIFPGFIDPHVHVYLPFMGTYAKDTWESASRAALVGGTTTLIEMICPAPADDPWDAFQIWLGKAKGQAACEYTFHFGVVRYDEDTEAQLRRIVDAGVTSFKVFLAYKGALNVNDEQLYKVCRLAQELGVVVTAHCENAELVAAKQAELVAAGKVGPEWHEPSRPVAVEAEGVHHFCTFLEATGATGYIVHTSNRDAVEAAMAFQKRGVDVTLETVIPYLTLDSTYAERPDFEGAKWVMSPPIRSKDHQDFLWQALADGTIATVGTDHAPFDFEVQKRRLGQPPHGNFTTIPNGIPSVEHRVTLLYTHGVVSGRLTPERFVQVASTNAAKQFGLYPRKGTIAPGSDADLVIWDPNRKGIISAKTHHMNTDYSGFEGVETTGGPTLVTVRGKIVSRNGQFVGEQTHGQFFQRQPTR